MAHRAIEAAWKLFTGSDWTTTVGGPTPYAMYADELSKYSDLELLRREPKDIINEIIRKRRVASKHRGKVQAGLKTELTNRTKRASARDKRKAGVR